MKALFCGSVSDRLRCARASAGGYAGCNNNTCRDHKHAGGTSRAELHVTSLRHSRGASGWQHRELAEAIACANLRNARAIGDRGALRRRVRARRRRALPQPFLARRSWSTMSIAAALTRKAGP